jgi:transposase
MARKRNRYAAAFKAQVALAALKGGRAVNGRAGHYGVHPTLVHDWKKQLLAGAEGLFAGPAGPQARGAKGAEAAQAELLEQIGRLKMGLGWLGKKAAAFG